MKQVEAIRMFATTLENLYDRLEEEILRTIIIEDIPGE
jgi:hypothetical protein